MTGLLIRALTVVAALWSPAAGWSARHYCASAAAATGAQLAASLERPAEHPGLLRAQIGEDVGMRSCASVHDQVAELATKGAIVREPGRSRGIRLA
ncbi:LexA family protein [Streptomyces echinatus]|uniref:LexA repressor DNA-binding domain-containing protein n=1 Tax=Streptomyces echinatus TaxID=67293 RepID=A0A7W9UVX3_9ACTN|nr:hypothetical protein [Streptomyces echinatus]MBB5932716.1 hypothetical protein [Streptomyces echinatus]